LITKSSDTNQAKDLLFHVTTEFPNLARNSTAITPFDPIMPTFHPISLKPSIPIPLSRTNQSINHWVHARAGPTLKTPLISLIKFMIGFNLVLW